VVATPNRFCKQIPHRQTVTLYERVRPLLFELPPERAHTLGKYAMRAAQRVPPVRGALAARYQYQHPKLRTECFGVEFPNPVGLAAGFDKNGEVTHAVEALDFGFTEVGTVTPYPQTGNEKPRMFRLPDQEGMINRLGFNGKGAERVRERLEADGTPEIPVGLNVGKMNTSGPEQAVDDYRFVMEHLYDIPDYFVVNVSCPNTPEEYDEQSPEHLRDVFAALADVNVDDKPLLVKVGPDSSRDALASLVDIVEAHDVDGIVATNTTAERDSLDGEGPDEWGGLSGAPLEDKATRTVHALSELTDLPIVGVGGVRDAETAYERIRHGASLVQLYTGFVYGGPATARAINRGLVDRLERDGFDSIEDAVGTAVEQ
jgi:dihydroorotate dehydrogenase